jgi:hypothetical protein
VDHALDLIATVIRPLAGWLGAYAVLTHWPAPLAVLTALGLGAGTLGLHLAKAKLRLGSTAVTLGHGNPLISTIEDLTAGVILLVAIVTPLFVLLIVAALAWALSRAVRARRASEIHRRS